MLKLTKEQKERYGKWTDIVTASFFRLVFMFFGYAMASYSHIYSDAVITNALIVSWLLAELMLFAMDKLALPPKKKAEQDTA